jgi:flavin-dependent dehydrogenase
VARENVALIGDASGSVDAVTGEGLSLLFQQAAALADALQANDLARYRAAHRRIARRPAFMSDLLLLLARRARLRRGAMRVMTRFPLIFAKMLALHVAEPRTALSSRMLAS